MDQLSTLKSYVVKFFSKPKRTKKVSVSDWYLYETFQILKWKSPKKTLIVFLIVNCYLCFLWTFFQFLAAIPFTALLIYMLYNILSNVPETEHLDIELVKFDINCFLEHGQKWLHDHPILFRLFESSIWIVIMMFTVVAGDIVFLHILLTMIFAARPIVNLPFVETLLDTIQSVSGQGVLAEEDLMPSTVNRDLNGIDTDTDSLTTNGTSDFSLDTAAAGITAMPSYWEVADVVNEVEEADLIPQENESRRKPGESSSDSESENKSIQFDSDNFENVSSSDEDAFSINLSLPSGSKQRPIEQEVVATPPNMLQSLMRTVSFGLMSNRPLQTNTNASTIQRQQSVTQNSDSEFEIIDPEEAKLSDPDN